MVSRHPDCIPIVASCDQVQPATVRSALLNRNSPRRHCVHHVRFQDLEEDEGAVAPGGRATPKRHRLGARPGSPHPNRKSPLGAASGSSAVSPVWDNVSSVATVSARVPPRPLTPGPTHQPPAVTRTHARSLEDIIGMEGPKDRMKRAPPNHLPCPNPAPQQPVSPPLPPLHTDSSHCPLVPMVTGSDSPTQIRRQRLGRALSDPGKGDLPCPASPHAAPPHTLPLCVAPPTAEKTERGVERGGVQQAQLPLPPMPPPPPPYCSSKERSYRSCQNHTPPMPRPPQTPPKPRPLYSPPLSHPPYTPPMPRPHSTPPTPSQVAPAPGGSEREKFGGRIMSTLKPTQNPDASNQQPNDSYVTADLPLNPDQARTLREVERLLGVLVSGDQGGGGSNGGLRGLLGPVRDVQDLKTRLQSLEGLLEASHSTTRLLLHVIQDLELKEGQSEQKTSQRTNQEGISTDKVIYSVEDDFILQERSFTQRWTKADSQISDPSYSPAIPPTIHPTPPNSNHRQKEPSQPGSPPFPGRSTHTSEPSHPARKSWRNCFWFL